MQPSVSRFIVHLHKVWYSILSNKYQELPVRRILNTGCSMGISFVHILIVINVNKVIEHTHNICNKSLAQSDR